VPFIQQHLTLQGGKLSHRGQPAQRLGHQACSRSNNRPPWGLQAVPPKAIAWGALPAAVGGHCCLSCVVTRSHTPTELDAAKQNHTSQWQVATVL